MSNERAIKNMVTAAELRLLGEGPNTPLETVDWSWRVTEQSEEDIAKDWRGYLSTWLTHPRCTMESTEGPESRGDDRFGLAVRGGAGAPRSKNVPPRGNIAEDLPVVSDRATGWGTHLCRQRHLATLWRSMTSSVE